MNAPITSPTLSSSQQSWSSLPSTRQSPSSMSSAQLAPPRPAKGATGSTDPFLRDFNLVAEAAKRAQMAVLMRDMESFGL